LKEIRLLCPSGSLGSGYQLSSLKHGLAANPDVIAADSGSNDGGPSYLGSGKPMYHASNYKRDLQHVIVAARQRKIPVLVGTAAGSGCDASVEFMAELVREIAREEELHLKLARLFSEPSREYLHERLKTGKIQPLWPSGPLQPETIDRAAHIVGMMGTEPYMEALDNGADVVIGGRASDAGLFAAVPMMRGFAPGLSWHAGKILECGSAVAEHRKVPDCMFGIIRDDHFIIYPPDPELRCTTVSVAAHTLYENAHPYLTREPSGTLITTECRYEAVDERSVKVTGSQFEVAPEYTIKLEAAELVGYHTVSMAGIRDPFITRDIDNWLAKVRATAEKKVKEERGLDPSDYLVNFRVYGHNAVMGLLEPVKTPAHELGIVFEAFAATQDLATAVCVTARYVALHHWVPQWTGQVTNLAIPHSPPEMERGPAYRFTMHHAVVPETPTEMFRLEYETV
jgi:hypothetical protein